MCLMCFNFVHAPNIYGWLMEMADKLTGQDYGCQFLHSVIEEVNKLNFSL